MSEIVLLDTSVYLNVLDVPGWNQDRADVLEEFAIRVNNEDIFLLPMATIWETGNHIADLPTGGRRRQFALILVNDVTKALNGEAPYRPTHFPDREEFIGWLREFPDYAKRNKSAKKTREGVSLADLSIIKEWQRTCTLHPMSQVLIWSLDTDLSAYN
ncbi:MAG: hypothetical protein DM484_21250 [Candidatus Methylumidiphilus alinenensis]|uniref:PIN domain-containing protein n=1 Tax=Candidatus Methylumidiphilus alinenensis TaxID=2202197 RepID=A0A2W4R2V1_9GAMM|nr:MAG: hypothetical protein DM484_21250 [Candidatus Methylumidiphilus alinenensis]